MDRIEDNLHVEVFEENISDAARNLRTDLVYVVSKLHWVLVTLCTGGANFHVPSPRDNAEWLRELKAIGADVQGSFENESRWTTPRSWRPAFGKITSRTAWPLGRMRFSSARRKRSTYSLPGDVKISITMKDTRGSFQNTVA